MNRSNFSFCIIPLLLLLLFMSACSITRQVTEEGPSEPAPPEDTERVLTEEERELQQLLDRHRDTLDNNKKEGDLSIPKVFTRVDTTGGESPVDRNPYRGYRIQLISTRNVQKADRISKEFQKWIRSMVPQYPARSYVTFKQPYYKVHVGDFQSRTRAIRFNRLIKDKYPGAWIVPDRINPADVAADSVTFGQEKVPFQNSPTND